MSLKIISYNVNGIRAAIKKGWVDWVKENDFDVICVQETKAMQSQVPTALFDELGYHHYWHSAEKKGYSGVATFTKVKPTKVEEGSGMKKYDREGRILRTDFGDWTLLNCYFPSGSSGEERHEFKMEFLDDFEKWIKKLKKQRDKLIVVGDYNIVHTELDIHNPTRKDNPSGYRPAEREWMSKWFRNGFVDAFRQMNPELRQFSWWSYRAGARGKDKGWRIDYQSVSKNMADNIKQAYQMKDAVHSDHCPVFVEIDI